MPIDYKKYPPNWKTEIRPRILARDGHRCKFCHIADGLLGWWVPGHEFYTPEQFASAEISDAVLDALIAQMARKPGGRRVRLTTAHLDHGLTNHDDDNLAALCQRCHLNYDRKQTATQRRQSRRYSRRKKQLRFDFLTV